MLRSCNPLNDYPLEEYLFDYYQLVDHTLDDNLLDDYHYDIGWFSMNYSLDLDKRIFHF